MANATIQEVHESVRRDLVVPYSLDDYFKSTPIGSIERSIGNNLYGINHTQVSGLVPSNKDHYGLAFIVRPQLALNSDNIRMIRQFYPLLTDNSVTMQRFVRTTLDPRLIHGFAINDYTYPTMTCPLIDNDNCFIPILTNNLVSMSGWPDLTVNTFKSSPGLYSEEYAMVDSRARNMEVFDLDLTFRNTHGDPIIYMFYVWLHTMANTFEGTMMPYPDFIGANELDYTTRIYRLVLDKDKDRVVKLGATGQAFPISVPLGSFFDYSIDKPYNDQNKEISVRFRCMGAEYLDDILVYEFNTSVCQFKHAMYDQYRDKYMVKLDKTLQGMFNNRGYPRINPDNYKLEWWVDIDQFNAVTTGFLTNNLADLDEQDAIMTGD